MKAKLHTPRQAAQILGVSYPALKQWIYKKKINTVLTAGGHHRIADSELDRFLPRKAKLGPPAKRRGSFRRISGRNQLIGRITEIRIDGLLAQITLAVGEQRINSIITSDAAREMRLKVGETAAALIKSTEIMIIRPE